jgi:hypothetical protein
MFFLAAPQHRKRKKILDAFYVRRHRYSIQSALGKTNKKLKA